MHYNCDGMEGLSRGGVGGAVLLTLFGCGPTVHEVGGADEGDGDTTLSTDTGAAEADASDASAAGDSSGPAEILDVGAFPEPIGACEFPVPPLCEPQWPASMTIGGGPASAINLGNALEVWVGQNGSGSPEFIWALRFEIPCPETSPVPDDWRFEVEGEVSISQAAEFEYTHVGMYAATIDAELHNACAHLQLHGIDVAPSPLEAGAPDYAWPDMPPLGFFGAAVYED